MDSSEFGVYAGLVWAASMFAGVWMDRLWLAKIRPILRHKPTMSFKELQDRISHER